MTDTLYQIESLAVAAVDARIARAKVKVSDEDARKWLLEARQKLRDTKSRRCMAKLDAWRQEVPRPDGTALTEAVAHLDRL